MLTRSCKKLGVRNNPRSVTPIMPKKAAIPIACRISVPAACKATFEAFANYLLVTESDSAVSSVRAVANIVLRAEKLQQNNSSLSVTGPASGSE